MNELKQLLVYTYSIPEKKESFGSFDEWAKAGN